MSMTAGEQPRPAAKELADPTIEQMSVEDALEQVRYLIVSGHSDKAEVGLGQILAHSPDDPAALATLGLLHFNRKRLDEALAAFRRVVELTPEQPLAWLNLGNILIECRQLEEAAAALRRVVELDPTSALAYNSFGVACLRARDLTRAEAAFQEALSLDPDSVHAHFNYARLLEQLNRPAEAAGHGLRTLDLDPDHPQAHELLFRAHSLLGERDKALAALDAWAKLQPDNPEIEHYRTAMRADDVPLRAPDHYVQHHFDGFAANFDERLRALEYRAPVLVRDALLPVSAELPAAAVALDAGCGTGLCAPLLAPHVERLVGVDLSDGMLQRARERGGYAALHQGELTAFLQTTEERYDLIVSADTLCYFGDLAAFLAAAHASLQGPGLLIFSLEALNDDDRDYELRFNGRYCHSRRYTADALAQAGFAVRSIESQVLRKEFNEPVQGWIVTASHR